MNKTLKIGKVELKNPFILAPMAGVSDMPYRTICSYMGAGMVCSEMVSAKAIMYNNKKTDALMEIGEDEAPVSIQLFGNDPKIISEMAKRIEERPFAILDINMGCPVPKVVNNGEGSALMKDPVLVGKIVESTAKAIQKPVTVKIRKGFNDANVNAVEIAKVAEQSGALAVTVHGRTREQYYSGKADWDIIAAVKDAVSIPVIGNGDIVDAKTAEAMFLHTGCDGVAVGRAAQGNPFIFKELVQYFDNGEIIAKPPLSEIKDLMKKHLIMQIDCKGEYLAVREMRKHIAWYTAGYPNSSALRRDINKAEDKNSIIELIDNM